MKAMDRIEVVKGEAHYFLSHKEVSEDEYYEVYPRPKPGACFAAPPTRGWPMLSMACGVHGSQIDIAREHDKAHGLDVHYVKKGLSYMPEFRDRAHRRAYMKSRKVHDNDGGYGDG